MTRDEAIKEADGKQVVMRSCWRCNGAHEHLKNADYVVYCVLGCGRFYWKGIEIHRAEFEGCHDNDQVRLSDVVDVKVELSVPPRPYAERVNVDVHTPLREYVRGDVMRKTRPLSSVLEELCPGVRRRNWPPWAGPYTEPDEPEDK